MPNKSKFEQELTKLLNSNSMENGSNTPDFLLAEFLVGCLKTYNETVVKRTNWFRPEAGQPAVGEYGPRWAVPTGQMPNIDVDPPAP